MDLVNKKSIKKDILRAKIDKEYHKKKMEYYDYEIKVLEQHLKYY